MNTYLLRTLCGTIVVFMTAGCATDAAMRQVAGSSAGLVNEFKLATQSFVGRMNDLNDADTARLRRLASQTQAMQTKSAAAETGWSAIADDDALTMYGALTRSQPSDVIAGSAALKSLKVDTDAAAITADAGQFDSLVKKLNALAAEPTFPELLQSWVAFGKQVNDALQKDMKDAGTALQSTDKAAQAKSTALTNPK